MKNNVCSSCGKAKANLSCGLCHTVICKSCAQFIEPDQFSFLPKVPKDLSYSVYCDSCFTNQVSSEIESYNQKMTAAKNVAVYLKKQSKETRLIKRTELPVQVTDCPDHDEAILRLAFLAILANCNSIVDVQLTSKKTRTGSYQSLLWSGSALPANIDESQLIKDRSFWHNPN